jgi:hypothetical protein
MSSIDIDGTDSTAQTWSMHTTSSQPHENPYGCHPKHVEQYPRKPNADIALNNDIADIDEQVSSDMVHTATFSKYQPRERKRSSHRKGGASNCSRVDKRTKNRCTDRLWVPTEISNEQPLCTATRPCAQSRVITSRALGWESESCCAKHAHVSRT